MDNGDDNYAMAVMTLLIVGGVSMMMVRARLVVFPSISRGSPSEGHNPPQGSPRKFASQRVLRDLRRGLFEGSAGLCGAEGSDPLLVTLWNCWSKIHVWFEMIASGGVPGGGGGVLSGFSSTCNEGTHCIGIRDTSKPVQICYVSSLLVGIGSLALVQKEALRLTRAH